MNRQNILGYETVAVSLAETTHDIAKTLDAPDVQCRWMACMNPHSYVIARSDLGFSAALRHADWLVPDGVGILVASRILRCPLPERITGFDVFEGAMHVLDARGGSVFFLGSTPDVLDRIADRLLLDYPNVRLAGRLSPPFKSLFSEQDNSQMITQIAEASPDILWVGMTAPKQEKWIAEMQPELQVKFVGAIGAVFDFYAGTVKRSHPVFQRMGLEWLPRLLQQPRRLWRRVFISAPIFMRDVLKAGLSNIRDQ